MSKSKSDINDFRDPDGEEPFYDRAMEGRDENDSDEWLFANYLAHEEEIDKAIEDYSKYVGRELTQREKDIIADSIAPLDTDPEGKNSS
ncbi:MAG: hypothetical protein HYX78_00460 [Armatimonadetes bacterium]|nr:hypothetical protein [Armatimonadota bacterium]